MATKYYKIQFPPYEDFQMNYLYFHHGKNQFIKSGFKTANIFREEQIESDELKKYLCDKEYRLIQCDGKLNTMFFYRH